MSGSRLSEPPARSRIETEVLRLRALLAKGELAETLEGAQSLLQEVPENRDVWYLIAVAQRYLQRIPEALATLARFEQLHPLYSRLFQERGHCYAALREAGAAIEAYERAVNINPALPASWNSLRILYDVTGRKAQSENAAAHVATLSTLPEEIVTANSMFADGEVYAAEQIVRRYLLKHGDHVEGMRLLARIGMKLDVLDDAELLLDGVLRLEPEYRAARHDYAMVLLKRHKHASAREELERLVQAEPDNRAFKVSYASALVGLGQHERAVELYRKILAEIPQAADLHLSIAHALKTLGKQPEAIDSYRAAIDIKPGYGDAYWSLANLKTYKFPDTDIVRMRAEEQASGVALEDHYHLCFALGKALEDRAEYAESFRYYEHGNALKKAETRFKIEPIERNTRLQTEVCTSDFFAARRDYGCPSDEPIFIVGLPRAGSTLLEQILASHSQVEGTLELPDIPRLVGDLQGRDPDP